MPTFVSSPTRRPRSLEVIALAAATTLASGFAAATTSPATSPAPVDWNLRIQDSLLRTGNVDAVSLLLAKRPADDPSARLGRIDVALEQGDLMVALGLLQTECMLNPSRPALMRQLAYVQECVGQTAAASRTLKAAMASSTDRPAAAEIGFRLALIAFDASRPSDGIILLDNAVAADPSLSPRAGVIAYLEGQYTAAVRYLCRGTESDVSLRLLGGNAALKAGQSEVAIDAFKQAYNDAHKPGDRLYAQERLIAAARQAGTLGALADQWLADKSLPNDRLLPLAVILRELNRVPELVRWWRAEATIPSAAEVVLSDRFVNEMLGAARAAGRSGDAAAISRGMLDRNPDSIPWLSITLRSMLAANQTTEADQLLRDRLAKEANSPADIEKLGKLGRSLGRDAVAVQAARQLSAFGGAQAIPGKLLEASVAAQSGEHDREVALLKEASAMAVKHPAGVEPVVRALEGADLNDAAIRLLQSTENSETDEAAITDLASLLMESQQQAQAIPLLQQLARTGSSESVRAQAGQRLLQAARATGQLTPIMDQLRTRLAAGQGSVQDLSLLVDALVQQHDYRGAANLLNASKLLSDRDRLEQLAVVYLRAKMYDPADDVLHQLVALEPSDNIETLENLANNALNRKNPAEAEQVVAEIARRVGDGPAADENLAGIFARLGRYADAAAAYRRALAINPADADDWLLWSTAMSKIHKGSQAAGRLEVLCSDASTDNVFATAVDGLLNLNARAAELQVARRDAILRVAATPHSVMLYHVIADVSDEMQDSAAVLRATDAGACVSEEERPQRLRELMDVACQRGDVETAINCGRTLLALGDDFPPELFLQLGEQLLIDGRAREASSAFARAAEGFDSKLVISRTAAIYQQYGYYAEALDTLIGMRGALQGDAESQQNLANLYETTGKYDSAFDHNLAALRLTIAQVIADKSSPAASGGHSFTVSMPGVNSLAAMSPGALAFPLKREFASSFATAQTPLQQSALVELLRSNVDRLLADPAAVSAPFPNALSSIEATLRWVYFALGRKKEADELDVEMIAKLPAPAAFERSAYEARRQLGLIELANQFAVDNGLTADPLVNGIMSVLGPAATTPPTTRDAKVTIESAAAVLPSLLARGEIEKARELLQNVPFDKPAVLQPPGSMAVPNRTASPYLTLVTAAVMLGDQQNALQWATAWLNSLPLGDDRPHIRSVSAGVRMVSAGRMNTGNIAYLYNQLLSNCSRLLDATETSTFHDRYLDRALQVKDENARRAMAYGAIQAAAAMHAPLNDPLRWARLAVQSTSGDMIANDVRIVACAPPADRPATLQMAVDSLPPGKRLRFFVELMNRVPDPLDGPTQTKIADAVAKLADGQDFRWNDWFEHAGDTSHLCTLAEAILRTATVPKSRTTALTAAAVALSNAGDSVRADQVAAQALDALRIPPAPPDPSKVVIMIYGEEPADRFGLVRAAVASMSNEAKNKSLAALNAEAMNSSFGSSSDSIFRNLLRVDLLDALGRRDEALVALRAAYQANPTDKPTTAAYMDRLTADGRLAELVASLQPHASVVIDTLTYQVQAAIARSLQTLYRWREAQSSGNSLTPTVDMTRQEAAGDVNGLAESLRVLLQDRRQDQSLLQLPEAAPRGGLSSSAKTDAPPYFDELSRWPGAVDDLIRDMQWSGGQISSETPWPDFILVRACADPVIRQKVIEQLRPLATAHLLSPNERIVLAGIATLPNAKVPPEMIEALWPAAMASTDSVELQRLCDALAAQQSPLAASASRWMNAAYVTPNTGNLSATDGYDDATFAGYLKRKASKNPADAENELRSFRATGRIGPRFHETNALWVRFAGDRGDSATFLARADDLLAAVAWQRVVPTPQQMGTSGQPFDIRVLLPVADLDSPHRKALLDGLLHSLTTLAERWPSDTDITCYLSAVGSWADHIGEHAIAANYLRRAETLADAQGPGAASLWVADLASQLGHDDVSYAIQQQLLEQRCLPSSRIPGVLHYLESKGDTAAAHRLAADVVKYCAEPSVLRDLNR